MQKVCSVCKTKHIMLYSRKLHIAWCAEHMPKKEDYELALAKFDNTEDLFAHTHASP